MNILKKTFIIITACINIFVFSKEEQTFNDKLTKLLKEQQAINAVIAKKVTINGKPITKTTHTFKLDSKFNYQEKPQWNNLTIHMTEQGTIVVKQINQAIPKEIIEQCNEYLTTPLSDNNTTYLDDQLPVTNTSSKPFLSSRSEPNSLHLSSECVLQLSHCMFKGQEVTCDALVQDVYALYFMTDTTLILKSKNPMSIIQKIQCKYNLPDNKTPSSVGGCFNFIQRLIYASEKTGSDAHPIVAEFIKNNADLKKNPAIFTNAQELSITFHDSCVQSQ